MKIDLSEIQIIPCKPRNGLLAFVTFVLNKAFYGGDIALYSRLNQEGYRLVDPSKGMLPSPKMLTQEKIERARSPPILEIAQSFLKLRKQGKKQLTSIKSGRN